MKAVSQDHDFPPYDLLYALTDLFFKHINTWCPILHRRSTLDSLFGPNTLEEADRILLHAIVATTLRFSTDARLSDQARERYHSTSKQKVCIEKSNHSTFVSRLNGIPGPVVWVGEQLGQGLASPGDSCTGHSRKLERPSWLEPLGPNHEECCAARACS